MFKEEIGGVFVLGFAIILFAALAIILLFVTFNNRKNKLINEHLTSKLQNQKSQYELELKALRSQLNPHFIHNSLNAIQYYIQMNEVEKSEDYLSKFSKLMRQFFDYSRQNYISISEEVALLQNYLYLEQLRFEEKLEFRINIEEGLDAEQEQLPSMILQPIVENAVNHGIFHKKGKGLVAIHFRKNNPCGFQVIVVDDGIGINAARKRSPSSQHTNHSSSVIEERLHFLNISTKMTIAYTIEDVSETDETQTGTKVCLTFNPSQDDDY